MKVLILGGAGMLGHKLWQVLAPRCDTYVTLRRRFEDYQAYQLFNRDRTIDQVIVEEFDSIIRAFGHVRADVVVNCIGIVKQHAAAKDAIASLTVNALFPHQLARLCRAAGSRLIHISTDCVFSGRKGGYCEGDPSDAEDLYGRTKFLGEVTEANCLTLRTSIIGPELGSAHGLLEWFLGQRSKTVHGYKRAVFSGLTTSALAEVIAEIITQRQGLEGLWHVAADPISKYDLLSLIQQVYQLPITIAPDKTFVCDRSLNGSRFRQATGWRAPGWKEMIEKMRVDHALPIRHGVVHVAG